MKRKLLCILTLCLLSVCLFACADGSIAAITPVSETNTLTVGSSVAIADLVKVEGKGKLYYTIDTPEILALEGGKITALTEGDGILTVSGGDVACRLIIKVSATARASVGLADAEYPYDGTPKFPTIVGAVPDGSQVTYTCGGAAFNGAITPGNYEVTIEVLPPEGQTVTYGARTATVKITKAFLNLSDIKFPSKEYSYDGTVKSLAIEGSLPDGVGVEYLYGKITDDELKSTPPVSAGIYIVRAVFSADETLYEPIPDRTARLVIERRDLAIDYSGFSTVNITYDGASHRPSLTLPEGVTAKMFVLDTKDEYEPLDEYIAAHPTAFIQSGEYDVKATFTLAEGLDENYNLVPDRFIKIYIAKARFVNNMEWEISELTYNGSPFTIGIGSGDIKLTGARPVGVGGEFSSGASVALRLKKQTGSSFTVTDAGDYTVTAVFTMPDGYEVNYLPLEEMPCLFTVRRAQYPIAPVFDGIADGKDYNVEQVYDEQSHYFSLKFSDAAQEARFLGDITVKYYRIKGDSELKYDDGVLLSDVGEYTIGYTVRFKSDFVGVGNYYLPEEKSIRVRITPMIFDVSAVRFETIDGDVVYNGQPHIINLLNVPARVTVGYEYKPVADKNYSAEEPVNAGDYDIRANFAVAGIIRSNYRIVSGGKDLEFMYSTIKIKKAAYDPNEVPTYTVTGGVYSPDKTLGGAYPLSSGARWMHEDEVPVCNVASYAAVYNRDSRNYLDYYMSVPIAITPLVLDINEVSIGDQFVAQGNRPKALYGGTPTDAFSVTFDGEDDFTEFGVHELADVELLLADEINYRLTGSNSYDNFTVYVYNAFAFEYNEPTLMLVKYKGGAAEVEVPFGTKSIYSDAFAGKNITTLKLPSSLERLSQRALRNISGLVKLQLPFTGTDSAEHGRLSDIFDGELIPTLSVVTVTEMTVLPAKAFADSVHLTAIEFKNPVIRVGMNAFENCTSLIALDLSRVERIGANAFRQCVGLKSLKVPFVGVTADDLRTADYFFSGNTGTNAYTNYSLETLDISAGEFTAVPDGAFKGLINLQSIVLPETVRSIGKRAFENCGASVNLNSSLSAVTEYMFYGYKGDSVTLPQEVTGIENHAFSGATALEKIILPAGVNYIGEYAFEGVSAEIAFSGGALTTLPGKAFARYLGGSVALPSSITAVGNGAFEESAITGIVLNATLSPDVFKNCESLMSADITATVIPARAFYGCKKLTTVVAPNINRIGESAFEGCEMLFGLTIPAAVSVIEDRAFFGSSIRQITFESAVPPSFGNNVFSDSSRTIELYVPEAGMPLYMYLEDEYTGVTVRKTGAE